MVMKEPKKIVGKERFLLKTEKFAVKYGAIPSMPFLGKKYRAFRKSELKRIDRKLGVKR